MSDEDERIATSFRGRIVLVTGAFGFIGSQLSARLRAAGASVRMLYHRAEPEDAQSNGNTAVRGDLLDPDLWGRVLDGVETVFHLAAQTSARASERDPLLCHRVNTEATWRLLEACRRAGKPLDILFAGTVTQHGKPERLPLSGREPDAPISFYDLHKQLAEQYLEFYARHGVVRATSLRLPTVYGPGRREGSADCGVVNAMIRSALAGETLTIYGMGDRLRDFIHVDDVARAFLLAACSLERCNAQHFLLGSGAPLSLKDAIHQIALTVGQELGRAVPVAHVEPPADELEIAKCSFAVDPTPFESAAGFRPAWPFSEGILQTVRYFRDLSTNEPARR